MLYKSRICFGPLEELDAPLMQTLKWGISLAAVKFLAPRFEILRGCMSTGWAELGAV